MDPLARCGRAFLNSVPSDVQSLDEMFVAVNFHCKRVTMRQSESLPIFVVFFLMHEEGSSMRHGVYFHLGTTRLK